MLELILEFTAISLVTAVVYSATQSESPREIARRSVRFFAYTTVGLSLLAGGIAFLSSTC